MKKTRLLTLTLLLINIINAQVPPPPCGLTPVYACDFDEDGEVIVDLTVKFPFDYCNVDPNEAINYTMSYYLTEQDATNTINVIADPENFLLTNDEEEIFRRADAISSSSVLIASDVLIKVIPPTPNTPSPFIKCNTNENGFEVFDLDDKVAEILSGQSPFNYDIDFYQTFEDASILQNEIGDPNNYVNIIPWQQTIYASVSVELERDPALACVEVVEFNLIVQNACEDLAVYLYNPGAPPRPGFSHDNILYIENNGTTTIASGSVMFEYDTNLVFNSAFNLSPSVVITTTATGFNVDFTDLEIGELIEIDISLTCPVSVPLGTLITNIATYTSAMDDVNEFNDVFVLRETVVGSYDPNDKMESHGLEIVYNEFITSDEYFYYTIRFQNVGTAEALDVRIEDVLDAQLNPSTFEMISSSHSYIVLREGDKLTWTFSDINLPAEQDDPEGSNGFVFFRIKPVSGYAIGTIIPNAASIFFDFNAPIVTNVFNSEFVRDVLLGVDEFDFKTMKLFPNPSDGRFNLQFHDTIESAQLSVYNVQGKRLWQSTYSNSDRLELDLSAMTKGIYFMKMTNNGTTITKKLIIN